MKKYYIYSLFILFGLTLNTSCIDRYDEEPYYNEEYSPILMKKEDLEKSVKILSPRPVREAGKINIVNDKILIVDKYKGVHIINNSDPVHPEASHFIAIPGCIDVAVKDGYLYADNAIDLVVVDISTFSNIRFIKRLTGVFPELCPPNNNYIPYIFNEQNRPANTVIVGWTINNQSYVYYE